jgi:hypothetical protein
MLQSESRHRSEKSATAFLKRGLDTQPVNIVAKSDEKTVSDPARSLFQRAVDRSEFRVELTAKPIHDRDDGECNTGRDQSIFDGGSGGFVGEKSTKCFHIRNVLLNV